MSKKPSGVKSKAKTSNSKPTTNFLAKYHPNPQFQQTKPPPITPTTTPPQNQPTPSIYNGKEPPTTTPQTKETLKGTKLEPKKPRETGTKPKIKPKQNKGWSAGVNTNVNKKPISDIKSFLAKKKEEIRTIRATEPPNPGPEPKFKPQEGDFDPHHPVNIPILAPDPPLTRISVGKTSKVVGTSASILDRISVDIQDWPSQNSLQ